MNYYYSLLLILLYSCGDQALTPEEQAAQALANQKNSILLTMSENLELNIKLQKFTEDVSYMTFHIVFDPEALEIVSYSAGDFGNPWSNMDVMDVNNDSVYCSFAFASEISGSGDLLNLTFQGKSSSSYEESIIYVSSILLEDENGDEIIFSGDNSLNLQDVCYIDEGLLIAAELNLPGPLSESWEPTNNYVWSNSFCGYY